MRVVWPTLLSIHYHQDEQNPGEKFPYLLRKKISRETLAIVDATSEFFVF